VAWTRAAQISQAIPTALPSPTRPTKTGRGSRGGG
jgi:hypothetical protein